MDYAQIIKDCYDPTNHALRVTYGDPDIPCAGKLDAPQIIKFVYVPALHALKVSDPVEGSGTYGCKLSAEQVIKKIFNTTTGELTIVGTAVAVGDGGGHFADSYFAPTYFAPTYWD